MMRWLDATEVEKLGRLAEVNLSVYPLGSAMPRDIEEEAGKLLLSREPYHVHESGEVIAGFTLVNDISGKPALLVRVNMPRDIHMQAHATLRGIFWSSWCSYFWAWRRSYGFLRNWSFRV